ncbi:precorrin-6Y C5,15-methyltransferase (decarboxylating) [Hypericibacter terrae]|uniref:Precorrin-6Y C5,15-methyltransferase (Decarboxylating) n=1 Tax=Hypericibacter terrae TaxID=2602015 RepID=A0A5J6MN82_9PROT|nr:precorrin-6y C5,15-methyltransferase (decarboxylating) subunit CbiE [Hypericibacter terrae]QEX18671.1 precorrin-6Y C5,15-methyltransferase (decarboxylating) [Hypericibacter terrae]
MSRWLSVIGLTERGLDGLTAEARALIDQAELIVGGERHLALVPAGKAERQTWQSPLRLTIEEILRWRGRPVVVLASGDPMWFGVGVTLARRVAPDEMRVLPQVSAFTLAASRLGWSLSDTDCLTLHGRPLDLLNGSVFPGARLLMLTDDGAAPALIARRLTELGYGASRVVALEHMDGPAEAAIESRAADWGDRQTADLNTVAVECRAEPGTAMTARTPGLPDDAFAHDGQLTKREIRAAALAKLMPLPGALLWDVGAGCGSIAIEWMRAARGARAIAIESDAERVALIEANMRKLGTPKLQIVTGKAPAALEGLAQPTAIFLGGGVSTVGLIERCWAALPSGGRLVAHAVTVESEARLAGFRAVCAGELTRIAIQRAEPIGPHLAWRPLMPVTQLSAVKP